jgi:pyruvate/2-oxoglutarate/acetoin dehydrogenase E1 component
MKVMTYLDALREALIEEMQKDERVIILGEDMWNLGGGWGVNRGLADMFGRERVRETPISEAAFVGCAAGAAAAGLRPVVELMYIDFTTVCMDPIVNQIAKMKYMFGGKIKMPLVIRTQTGAGVRAAAQHSQALEAIFVHIPGLKVVLPSTPADAKGLLKSAIRDDNAVMIFEHKLLYGTKGEIPDGEYLIPIGKADIKRTGKDITVVGVGRMVVLALAAAEELSKKGIELEVVDVRTAKPLDLETIMKSIKKTGRAVTAAHGCKTGGIGSEIAAQIVENGFKYLNAPIYRVADKDTPIPFSPKLEDYVMANKNDIINAVEKVMKG